jgi:hypothetical protein
MNQQEKIEKQDKQITENLEIIKNRVVVFSGKAWAFTFWYNFTIFI